MFKINTIRSYDDINIGYSGHDDANMVNKCKNANGGQAGRAYVAPSSGGGWSHGSVSGVNVWLHECYSSDSSVNDRNSGCASNGSPMWNIGAAAAGSVYSDVLSLCKSVGNGGWFGIYAATAGLSGKENDIIRAINDCTK